MATITDEEKKSIVEEVKKQLLASAKSVQDFDKITELPESGSVTLPCIQPDGSAKTFDIGNWLRNNPGNSTNLDFIVQVCEDGFYVIDKDMNIGMQLTDKGFDAIGMDEFCKYLQTQEEGVSIVDGNLNIGYKVNTGSSSSNPSDTSSDIQFEVLGTI